MAQAIALEEIRAALADGKLIPYLGPGMLELMPDCPVPNAQEELASLMTTRVQVPHKIRTKLTAAAQFIENFKHRKTLINLMHDAFEPGAQPAPLQVQRLRQGCSFLFLGCRFNDQLQRSFARQIMKRSSERHWAVFPDEPTRNEQRFLDQQHIERIDLQLDEFEVLLTT